jgi:hypothetical protein
MAVTMENAAFWGVTLCRFINSSQHFGVTYRLHLQGYHEDGGSLFLQNAGICLCNIQEDSNFRVV